MALTGCKGFCVVFRLMFYSCLTKNVRIAFLGLRLFFEGWAS